MFTIKRSKSQRFFAFSIGGFRPYGKNRFWRFINAWNAFFGFLGIYLTHKIGLLLYLTARLIRFINFVPRYAKDFLVRKLIWSRGKLGRPIATAFVMVISLSVFSLGEFFSSYSFVVDQNVNADYIPSAVDIIPKRETAVTEIPDIRKRVEPFAYTVEGGDTLYGIGAKFKISIDALKYVNNLTDSSVLQPGQTITIPPASGLIHTVKSGDTLAAIADKYSVPTQAIADFNYLLDTTKLTVGTELVIPGAKVPEPIAPPVYAPPANLAVNYGQAAASKGFCVWPSTVHIITQNFSWYHNGIDVATPWSGGMPPLFACTSGRVTRAGWDPWGLGLHVRIDHGNGYETIYGHMSRLDVGYGQKVSRGQMIGLMGNTGNSTGPHVHYMVKYHGVAQNPLNFTN